MANDESIEEESRDSDNTEQKLSFLKKSRAYLRSSVSKNVSKINASLENLSICESEELIDKFTSLKDSLSSINDKVMENIYLQESNSVLINDELEMSEQYNCNIISAMRKLRHHIQNCKDSSVRAKCSTAVPHSTGTDHSTGIHQATSASDYTAFFNPTNPPCSTGTPFNTGLNYNVSNYSDYSYPYSSLNLYLPSYCSK